MFFQVLIAMCAFNGASSSEFGVKSMGFFSDQNPQLEMSILISSIQLEKLVTKQQRKLFALFTEASPSPLRFEIV